MSELYLLLTPVLLLAVFALVRFVGCNLVWGLNPTVQAVSTPVNLDAQPGGDRIELSWVHTPIGEAVSFKVYWGLQPQPFEVNKNQWIQASPGTGGNHSLTVSELDGAPLVDGATYYFVVTAVNDKGTESNPSNEDFAVVGVTFFVTSQILNNPVNQFDGWVGMAVLVGAQPLMVTALGRIIAPISNQPATVRIVNAMTGADLDSVPVGTTAEQDRLFAYANLASHKRLDAMTTYYFVMRLADLDQYYDYMNTTVTTTTVGSVTAAVYYVGNSTQPQLPANSAGLTYGPVDFKYYVAET